MGKVRRDRVELHPAVGKDDRGDDQRGLGPCPQEVEEGKGRNFIRQGEVKGDDPRQPHLREGQEVAGDEFAGLPAEPGEECPPGGQGLCA